MSRAALQTAWERIVAPSPALDDVGDRMRARLLASLLAVLVVGGLASGLVQLSIVPGFLPTFLAMLGALGVLGAAYAASRTRHYRAGGALAALAVLAACLAIPAWNVFLQPLWQAMIDGGVDVLLSGHSHNYERFAPQNASGGLDNTNGIRQFVVGTGGAGLYAIAAAAPHSEVRNNTARGVLKLTLSSDRYDWQFVPVAGASFTDGGSASCH